MPPGGTHFLYITSVVIILHVLPKTWAQNHPDNPLAKAIFAVLG